MINQMIFSLNLSIFFLTFIRIYCWFLNIFRWWSIFHKSEQLGRIIEVTLLFRIYYFFFYMHWFNSRKKCWHSDIPFWPRHLTTRQPSGLQRLRACSSILSSCLNLSIKKIIGYETLKLTLFLFMYKKRSEW